MSPLQVQHPDRQLNGFVTAPVSVSPHHHQIGHSIVSAGVNRSFKSICEKEDVAALDPEVPYSIEQFEK
jgi:predicted N-acetyltransferase YhbS